MQQFPMTVTFHPSQLTTEPSPTHRQILHERISPPDSTQDYASLLQLPVPSSYLSVALVRELPVIDPASSEADQ